jgi:proline racemase
MRESRTVLVLETPFGLLTVHAACQDDKVTQVTCANVPTFAVHLDAPVGVPILGTVPVDVAYGGEDCRSLAVAHRSSTISRRSPRLMSAEAFQAERL